MRGGPLASPDVLAALRPFLVTTWSGRPGDPDDPEVAGIWRSSEFSTIRGRKTNVYLFVLDSHGRRVHEFGGFPDRSINPEGYGPQDMVRYYRAELARATARLDLPETGSRPSALHLPDVSGVDQPAGVRVFVRTSRPEGRGGLPLVAEAVAMKAGEWEILAYPRQRRTIDAATVSPWLRQVYPPGFNEHLHPWRTVEGSLTLEPAGSRGGKRQAILRGPVRLATDERIPVSMDGTLEAVLEYEGSDAGVHSVRALFTGEYPRQDEFRGWVTFRVEATIESRPE